VFFSSSGSGDLCPKDLVVGQNQFSDKNQVRTKTNFRTNTRFGQEPGWDKHTVRTKTKSLADSERNQNALCLMFDVDACFLCFLVRNSYETSFDHLSSWTVWPGVDVMITIFCDFWQFSAKKIGVFLKNQCYDQLFSKIGSFWDKNANFFAEFFGENILKIITSVPGWANLRRLGNCFLWADFLTKFRST
jgi:hypothetical protein